MTSYDRGAFVEGRTINIEPCANGTFLLTRGNSPRDTMISPISENIMAFSSASDMLRFLQSEFTAGEKNTLDEVIKAMEAREFTVNADNAIEAARKAGLTPPAGYHPGCECDICREYRKDAGID